MEEGEKVDMFDRCEEVVESAQNVHDQVCLEAADASDVVIAAVERGNDDYM